MNTDVPQPQATTKGQLGRRTLQELGDWWILGILLILVIFFSIFAPGFFTVDNFVSTTEDASTTLILAVAETFVIITGGIDLSVGAMLGLSGMVSGWFMEQMLPHGTLVSLVVGLIGGIVAGGVLGLLNGLIITRLEVTPFISTLGMLGMATGFTFLISNGSDIVNVPQQVGNIGNTVWFQFLSVPFVISLVIVVIAQYFLRRTRFGRYTYALGSNREGARRAGINVKVHLLKIYTMAGLLSAIAGILILTRLISASPLEGQNDELNAIAAVVIGGASLFGGRGNIIASAIGALIISTLVNGLVILGVQPYWQEVSLGIIIIVAVYVDQSRYRNRVLR